MRAFRGLSLLFLSSSREEATLARGRLDAGGKQACLLHKIIFHAIAEQQLEFHSRMGHMLAQEGAHEGAMAWLRDAGKWQAILNIATTISGGDDDPTCKS